MISNVAKNLIDKYTNKISSSYDIHYTDELFQGAEFSLILNEDKIGDIFYRPGESAELDALVLASLELGKKIGPKYFAMANFREIENFLRDDVTKFAWERVLAYKESWEAAQIVLLRGLIYSVLLKSGLNFVQFPTNYEERTQLIQTQFVHINNVLGSFGLGHIDIVALEDSNLYVHYELVRGQPNSSDLFLALLDGVSEYLSFCYGSNSIKLVAQ
ncbi:hypothetical protein [Bacteriovorax sp. Seq25_V]|uniref:hypothetical protein n=1 Tax=Bacteriovorax sp. Seq25_V TaxID=1201288 RepID=UPI00038A2DF8|nr:hypothetical protein [Bacteriovorax sp. Seq25_V]EQC48063.1 hypothetical protein M900_1113 [Bacteriovorax sp. Seq25_V]